MPPRNAHTGYTFDAHGNLTPANPTRAPVPGSVNQALPLDAIPGPSRSVAVGSGGFPCSHNVMQNRSGQNWAERDAMELQSERSHPNLFPQVEPHLRRRTGIEPAHRLSPAHWF
jgi:hypothetical protein